MNLSAMRVGFAYACTILYTTLFFVVPGSWCPKSWRSRWMFLRTTFKDQIKESLTSILDATPRYDLVRGAYFVVTALLIPLVIIAALRLFEKRREQGSIWMRLLHDLGLRRPNVLAWRLLVVSIVVVSPFLWWMVRQEGFAAFFDNWVERSGWGPIVAYYLTVLFVEHFFFHGAIIAVTSRTMRWPAHVPVDPLEGGPVRRTFRWLGMARPVEADASRTGRILQWLGLPIGYLGPVVLAGLLFGAAHLGKNPREMLLSIPGGILCGYIAIRANSWLLPFLIHIGVGALAAIFVSMI